MYRKEILELTEHDIRRAISLLAQQEGYNVLAGEVSFVVTPDSLGLSRVSGLAQVRPDWFPIDPKACLWVEPEDTTHMDVLVSVAKQQGKRYWVRDGVVWGLGTLENPEPARICSVDESGMD